MEGGIRVWDCTVALLRGKEVVRPRGPGRPTVAVDSVSSHSAISVSPVTARRPMTCGRGDQWEGVFVFVALTRQAARAAEVTSKMGGVMGQQGDAHSEGEAG